MFAVNRALLQPLALEAALHGFGYARGREHVVLADDDPAAANTADRPDRVGPADAAGARVTDGALHATLPPRSWNVLRLARAA